MIRNILRLVVRNAAKNKMATLINVGGLAVGLGCVIMIMLWVHHEVHHDSFFGDSDRVYRVNWDYKWNDREGLGPVTPPPLAARFTEAIPDIESATRIFRAPKAVVRHADRFFTEERILGVDANFFDVLDFPVFLSNPVSVLAEPNTVILTEASAIKYFGSESQVGKTLTIGDDRNFLGNPYHREFTVAAIMPSPPENSHIQFDMLTSNSSYPEIKFFDWSWVWMQVVTYVKLRPDVLPVNVESKMPAVVAQHAPNAFKRIGFSFDELIKNGGRWNFVLQPLPDIYLGSSEIGNTLGPAGSRFVVLLFSVIAGFIILLACINFVNLTIARSLVRAKEVGLRKAMGSSRSQLFYQFLFEAVVYVALALPVSLILVELFLPSFNAVMGQTLHLSLLELPWLFLSVALLTVLVGVAAGWYPGVYLSSFRPVDTLKGFTSTGHGKHRLRHTLVIAQFAVTIALVSCTLLVEKQLHFVMHADMGFQKENVVVISNENNRLGDRAQVFKDRLQTIPDVIEASVTTGLPPLEGFGDFYKVEQRGDEQIALSSYMVDEDFLRTLNIRLKQGRDFSATPSADAHSVIINETAVRAFGWTEPLGQTISYGDQGQFTVIGIMQDFNFTDLYSPIEPFALFNASSKTYTIASSYVVVRLGEGGVERGLDAIKKEWESVAPATPFEFSFLTETFEGQYASGRRLGTIFFIFSALTIFIASIGLLGLSAFYAERRVKEIGIRKVLGASVPRLMGLLTGDFVRWVLLANIVACPVAWLAMTRWLEDFAYRTEVSWWIFAASGGAALVIAVATVMSQAYRASTANPVEALKYE